MWKYLGHLWGIAQIFVCFLLIGSGDPYQTKLGIICIKGLEKADMAGNSEKSHVFCNRMSVGVVVVVLYEIFGLVLFNQLLQAMETIVKNSQQFIKKSPEATNKLDHPVVSWKLLISYLLHEVLLFSIVTEHPMNNIQKVFPMIVCCCKMSWQKRYSYDVLCWKYGRPHMTDIIDNITMSRIHSAVLTGFMKIFIFIITRLLAFFVVGEYQKHKYYSIFSLLCRENFKDIMVLLYIINANY